MIESNLLPDFVLSIEDDQAPQNFLLARYAKMKGLPDPSTFKALEKPSEEQPVSIIYVEMCRYHEKGFVDGYVMMYF